MKTTKVHGPPGTGKTQFLLDVVEKAIKSGIEPERIAFMAFTRKAADEASARAIDRFKLSKDRLPWFRTLHSMAFKILGVRRDDIMQESHYKELGYELGFNFTDLDSIVFVPTGTLLGDKVAQIESLARLRSVSLQQQWEDCNFRDVNFASVKQWDAGLKRYKSNKGLLDYTDLLEQFSSALDVDLFILDEAQDLSPLQWSAVTKASANAAQVYLAGDSQQCIYEWAGAAPEIFDGIEAQENIILPHSYRVPKSVQELAQTVIDEMESGLKKDWHSRDAEGKVEYLMHEDILDLSKGTWLLLSRNHQTLSRFENLVQKQGFPYTKEGKHSTDGSLARAIISWERWRKGMELEAKDIKNLGKHLPQLQGWVPKGVATFEQSPLQEQLIQCSWMDALEVPPKRREYFRSCLANRESLFGKPRIIISTIHRAKGGEADHVVLIPDVSQKPWEQLNTDCERRVLYVALTRARETLTIIHPSTTRHYRI